MKINNALGFAGLLHGWDAETEQQRRRQEEDRVRQNNQDMFGITQALGNLRLGEQQRLGELGQFTQGAKLAQSGEAQDNFFANAPIRKATAEYGRMVEGEQLAAKQQLFSPEVVRGLADRNATGKLNKIQSQFVINDATSDTNKYNALVESMNELNANNVLKVLQLDGQYQATHPLTGGVVVHSVNDPSKTIPLALFKTQVLNSTGATKALNADIASTALTNRAVSAANARGVQSNSKANADHLIKLYQIDSNLLKDLDPSTQRYKDILQQVNHIGDLIRSGEHQ